MKEIKKTEDKKVRNRNVIKEKSSVEKTGENLLEGKF